MGVAMPQYLVVTNGFGVYSRGQVITDSTVIADVLASEYSVNVVLSGTPATVTLPNFLDGKIGLGTGSTTFVEMVGTGYAKVNASLGPMFAGSTYNTTSATFTAGGTWPTQTQFGFFDSAGNLLLWFPADTSVTLTNGQTISVSVGMFKMTFPDLIVAPSSASTIFAPGATIGTVGVNSVVAGAAIQVARKQIGLF